MPKLLVSYRNSRLVLNNSVLDCFYHPMFPQWFVGLILGTINPLTFGITAKISGLTRSVVNLEKMIIVYIQTNGSITLKFNSKRFTILYHQFIVS